MQRTDRELLGATRTGDAEAFGGFYRRYGDLVLAYFARRAVPHETAADLMMETFASALVALRKAKAVPPDPAKWLFTIAHHKWVDSRRRGAASRRARERLALERIELDDDDLRAVEAAVAPDNVDRRLAALPEAQAAAVRARILDGQSYAEMEHESQTPQSVLRMRVSRALRALRATAEETP
jgi:RNA polymerase sigma-70 factor (ECF subfamily)